MEEINYLSEPNQSIDTLGLGVFDGFHLGHQELFKHCDALLTFYPHPEFVLKPDTQLKLLTTLNERREIIPSIFIIEFTKSFSQLSPQAFLQALLEKINPKKIIVGFDFRFGHKKEGDINTLKKWGDTNNIEIKTIEPFYFNDELVKSSAIRTYLEIGKFDEAITLLGHSYLIKGTVVNGENRGSEIGFPTANLDVDPKKLIPSPGVYKGRAKVKGVVLDAAIYIGNKPTFGVYKKQIEVHILNFDDSIYGSKITIDLTGKIRDEKQFNSKDELVNQIKKDVESIR